MTVAGIIWSDYNNMKRKYNESDNNSTMRLTLYF